MKLYKIKKSDIDKKGKGLYATRNIREGEKIIDYIGKLITKKQTENSDKYDNSKPIYLFTVNKRYDLDGDFPWNTAGLINHSCENNCDYDGKGLKIWVKAIKDIKKGEELTCDYGFGYDKDYKQFPCKCKSKNCCGYIVRAESRWRINKKFSMANKNKLINNLMIESGQGIFDAMISEELIDEIVIYQAPKLLGKNRKTFSNINESLEKLSTIDLEVKEILNLGKETKIVLTPNYH